MDGKTSPTTEKEETTMTRNTTRTNEKTEDKTEVKSMSKTLLKYRQKYEPSICANGRKSLNNGDSLAHLLASLDPATVVALAERVLGLPKDELWAKYQHLNRGQQRMNAGNRIRGAVKRGDTTITKVKKALKAG